MIEITPFTYSGTIAIPFSKSYLQRAIAVAVASGCSIRIEGFTPSKDALAAREIAKVLGVESQVDGIFLELTKRKSSNLHAVILNCGEAGLSTRMFSPIAAMLSQDVTMTGEGSILVRPMGMVIDALQQLGATVQSNALKLPLHILGGIQPNEIHIDGSESSQLLTGLLIALAFQPEKSSVHVDNLKSIPYVDMTLDLLKEFGAEVRHENYQTFFVGGSTNRAPEFYRVEGDWSGASFHIVGAAMSGQVRLSRLNPNSFQADRAILQAVQDAGAEVQWNGNDLLVSASAGLKSFAFDATHCPDLFPPLAALAAACEGVSTIQGVNRLANKESNRALTIQSELAKLNIRVELDGDCMRIYGGPIRGGIIDSHNDHRIAMMGAVLAIRAMSPIGILNHEAVSKSYPSFFDDIRSIQKKSTP